MGMWRAVEEGGERRNEESLEEFLSGEVCMARKSTLTGLERSTGH